MTHFMQEMASQQHTSGKVDIALYDANPSIFVAAFDHIEELLGSENPVVRSVWLYLAECNLNNSRFTMHFNAVGRHGTLTVNNGVRSIHLQF